jgi:RNA polymerase sigma-70 factor (ECF subfamily)
VNEFSELLKAAREGDEEALAQLYERYGGPVAGAVRKRLGQPLRRRFDTLDLAHSVFAEVIRDLPRFKDRGELAFRHWLYIKVESKVASKLRKHLGRKGERREGRLSAVQPENPDTPSAHAAAIEETERARDIFEALDDDKRTLMKLRLDDGLSFAEIADRLGLPSADAARKRYARCLADLRRRWGP